MFPVSKKHYLSGKNSARFAATTSMRETLAASFFETGYYQHDYLVYLNKDFTMDLEARKIIFVQEFLRLQNEDIISGLEKLLRKRKVELTEQELQPMSIEQFNSEIDQSLEDVKFGRITSAKSLKEKIRKWN